MSSANPLNQTIIKDFNSNIYDIISKIPQITILIRRTKEKRRLQYSSINIFIHFNSSTSFDGEGLEGKIKSLT
eukprot:snap_masked-scaffold_17-processed-gene-6.42-mRNA-1 protein AED:1.00 eAED:1.00 QI:0/0/0/0/1/1/4/0/72